MKAKLLTSRGSFHYQSSVKDTETPSTFSFAKIFLLRTGAQSIRHVIRNYLSNSQNRTMAATKRLGKELNDMRNSEPALLRNVVVDDTNIFTWTGSLYPDSAPYNKAAFRVQLDFPAEYPFKPPKVTFKTKIYHPNIDEHGQVCLPITLPDHWKPATKVEQVVAALIALINEPEPDHALRAEIAEEFRRDKKKYMKNAEEYCKKHGEPRQ